MLVTLVSSIKFTSVCGKKINLKCGDQVFIDLETMIAYCGGVHFEIENDEFQHIH